MKPLNNTPTSDDGHRGMEHALPLLRAGIYNTLAHADEAMSFDDLCVALEGTHPHTLRTLLDALVFDRDVDTDGDLYWPTVAGAAA